MASNLPVNDAVIHAGPTANAAQHLFLAFGQHAHPAIIDEHDVKLLRPIGVAAALGAAMELALLDGGEQIPNLSADVVLCLTARA